MTLKDEAKQVFTLFFKNPDHLNSMKTNQTLTISKEIEFVINHIGLFGELPADLSLYSADVNMVIDIFKEVEFKANRKTVEFYDDIRYRYIDLIKGSTSSEVEPVQNSKDPMQFNHLYWMLEELGYDTMSETKKHRWFGFVQGILTVVGLINVEDERNATRDVFKGN